MTTAIRAISDQRSPRTTPASAPTDREQRTPDIDITGFGIDTIRVWGHVDVGAFAQPVQRLKQTVMPGGELSPLFPTTSSARLPGGVELTVAPKDGRATAVAEFSVPRWLRGDNTQPATLEETRDVIAEFHAMAGTYVDWECSAEEFGLQRLDIARDFARVLRPGDLLERLSHIKAPRCTTKLYRTEDCTGTQTLYRRTERWTTRLYERGHQYAERATARPGERAHWEELATQEHSKVRYEVQLRTAVLQSAGLPTVQDLTHQAMWAQAEKYFHKSCFGSTVGDGAAPLIAAATRALGHEEDPRLKYLGAVLGHAWLETLGLAPAVSRNTAVKYRGYAADWNISARDLVHGDFPRVRLDLRSGTLVPDQYLLGEAGAHVAPKHAAT
ncbi:hypothetical protein [Georgenia wangjunii]|uniref:hypothetical protein n=1 Tax=Georgenia wangjunii TaxID=3117730 RepID=UPI002F26B822